MRTLIKTTTFLLFGSFLILAACETPKPEESTEIQQPSLDPTLEELNKAILDAPNDPNNYVRRANYYIENNQIEQAFGDFKLALFADSTRSDIYYQRAQLFYNQGAIPEATADCERCITHNASETDCLLMLGEINIHLKQYGIAFDKINAALEVNEQLPFAYYMKGRIYKETGDTTLAASSYQTAIEVDPDYYDAYIEVALLYASAKSDLALEYYTTAIEIRPASVEARYNKAIYLQDTGFKDKTRYNSAFKLYDEILEIDPQNATAAYNKGYIYLEFLQKYDSAGMAFTQAIEIYPGYFQAYYNRGLCYESLNKPQLALEDYSNALKLQPAFDAAAIAKSRVLGY
ncbi:MAG: tetratricopeptide repeat protein [Cryomorphaceae bacterium]|nr:tetratricopeptide repeat protein [Cryomorphaceae bacterium]